MGSAIMLYYGITLKVILKLNYNYHKKYLPEFLWGNFLKSFIFITLTIL